MIKKVTNGVIVGRFQPFHKGHLEYLLKALEKSQNLFIGITTPSKKASKYEPQTIGRLGKEANPYSYSERRKMIQESLKSLSIDLSKIHFVHFRPNKIKEWFAKVPTDATYFLILILPDDKDKAEQMRVQGLKVEVLSTVSSREHRAYDIRERILNQKPWMHLVPEPVAVLLASNK